MEHLDAWTLLDEYHDAELSPSDASQVRDHLKGCPECAEALAGRVHLTRAISEGIMTSPSDEFVRSVKRLALNTADNSTRTFHLPVPAMALGLAASAFIMVGLFYPAPNEPSHTGLISTTFEYEKGGPMPVLEEAVEIADHDQVLGSLLEES